MARAVKIKGAGGVDVLGVEEIDEPSLGPGQVMVAIHSAGLNRADILQRRGFYPAPKGVVQDVPGLEFAGTVAAVGPGASRWTEGQRVMGICAGGGMSTHLAVDENHLVEVPEGMELGTAAAIPEVFFTAFDALEQGAFSRGKTVLIHAIGSGVGSAALQLVKEWKGHTVGTSRSVEKLERASRMGLDEAVLVEDNRFSGEVLRRTERRGCDVILDFVGAAYLGENVNCLATRGRLIVIGLLGGIMGQLPIGVLLQKRGQIIGTVLRNRSSEEKAELTSAFAARVMPGFVSGAFQPVVHETMPMRDIARAHELLESNKTFGKIVMTW